MKRWLMQQLRLLTPKQIYQSASSQFGFWMSCLERQWNLTGSKHFFDISARSETKKNTASWSIQWPKIALWEQQKRKRAHQYIQSSFSNRYNTNESGGECEYDDSQEYLIKDLLDADKNITQLEKMKENADGRIKFIWLFLSTLCIGLCIALEEISVIIASLWLGSVCIQELKNDNSSSLGSVGKKNEFVFIVCVTFNLWINFILCRVNSVTMKTINTKFEIWQVSGGLSTIFEY